MTTTLAPFNQVISPDVIFYMSQYLTPFETVYILARVCHFWRASILQQRKALLPQSNQGIWFRGTILDYIQECKDTFHPNSAPLNHFYDNLLFRYIIDRTAVGDKDKHIDTLLKEKKVRMKQIQQQHYVTAASGRRINLPSIVESTSDSGGTNVSESMVRSVFDPMFVRKMLGHMWNVSKRAIGRFLMPGKLLFHFWSQYVMNIVGTYSADQLLEIKHRNEKNAEPKSIKLCICGDENIGKTALFNRFCHNRFIDRQSRGALSCVYNVYCKYSKFENKANLEVWNTTGVETFNRPLLTNMGHSNCFLLCFDITNRQSFENVDSVWLQKSKMLLNCNPFVEYVLVGLKGDLDSERQVGYDEAARYASSTLNSPYIEVSSLHDLNTNTCTFVSVLFAYIIVVVFFRMKVTRAT